MFKRLKTISGKEAKSLMEQESAVLLDVRSPQEFLDGHISGAVSLPLDKISSLAEKMLPEKEAAIIVYCLSGMRSGSAAQMLTRMGYQNIRNLGAMHNWK